MRIEEVQKNLEQDDSLYAYIKSITEADFGCEERLPGEPLLCIVELITTQGIHKKEIPDEWLVKQGLDEGSYISVSLSKELNID